jgi:arylsulfatase A-like enzyme
MKQIPSFFGGARQGMAISWPARIKDTGGVRWQFHHVIDIVPTILEGTGIRAPDMVDGIAQKPIEGVSMAYTFDSPTPAHRRRTKCNISKCWAAGRGTGVFKVDGTVVATQTLERTVPLTLPWDETFDTGADTGTPVDDRDYQVPFRFTGRIDKLTISVAPPVLTPPDLKRLEEAYRKASDH